MRTHAHNSIGSSSTSTIALDDRNTKADGTTGSSSVIIMPKIDALLCTNGMEHDKENFDQNNALEQLNL